MPIRFLVILRAIIHLWRCIARVQNALANIFTFYIRRLSRSGWLPKQKATSGDGPKGALRNSLHVLVWSTRVLEHLLSYDCPSQGGVSNRRSVSQHPVHDVIELPRPHLVVVLNAAVLELHLLDLLAALVARAVDAPLAQNVGDAVEHALVAQGAFQLDLHRLVRPQLEQLHDLLVGPVAASLVPPAAVVHLRGSSGSDRARRRNSAARRCLRNIDNKHNKVLARVLLVLSA